MSGEATVRHVELFIRRKMELSPGCQVSASLTANEVTKRHGHCLDPDCRLRLGSSAVKGLRDYSVERTSVCAFTHETSAIFVISKRADGINETICNQEPWAASSGGL